MKDNFNYKYDDLFNPTLTALHNLGGSGSLSEIEEEVSSILGLSDKEVNEIGPEIQLNLLIDWLGPGAILKNSAF